MDSGLRLTESKCVVGVDSVTYLGHVVDAAGLHATDEKVKAITDAPEPKDVPQLRSFLGLVNLYHKFLPNLSSTLAPLHSLPHKDTKWSWGEPTATAVEVFHQSRVSIEELQSVGPPRRYPSHFPKLRFFPIRSGCCFVACNSGRY